MNKSSFACMAALLALSACGENTVKETLGIDRRAPDEYRVVSRPPLSVPPQFDLKPPSVAGVNNQSSTRAQAESLVLGNGSIKADTAVMPVSSKSAPKAISTSAAESVFLQKAGTANADPNVKQALAEKKIDEQIKKEEEGFWDKVTTLPENKEPVVKAKEETDRLKKNQEEGKPVTEGKTPETGGGPVSMIRRWFGD